MIVRSTIQCTLVREAVNELKCHATADEVYAAVIKQHPAVSRATVYRNLKRLSDSGEIRRIEMPGGPDHYDHRLDAHYHARCGMCGRVFDVDMDTIPDIESRIRDTHGFRFSGHDILFTGTCRECAAKN